MPSSTPNLSQLSLYRHALARAEAAGIALHRLDGVPAAVRTDASLCQFQGRVRSMHDWCRRNETLVLREGMSDATVYAGFQRLSRVRPVRARYDALAQTVRSLHLLGIEDEVVRIQRAHVVPLVAGNLAREWFLLIDAPHYKALLVARDLDGFDGAVPLRDRRFVGFSTHHPELVRSLATELSTRVEGGVATESAVA